MANRVPYWATPPLPTAAGTVHTDYTHSGHSPPLTHTHLPGGQWAGSHCTLYATASSYSHPLVGTCIYTDTLHHADNYLPVDRFVTPRHIVPEWYFLVWYSILRSCASKVVDVVLPLLGVLHVGQPYEQEIG